MQNARFDPPLWSLHAGPMEIEGNWPRDGGILIRIISTSDCCLWRGNLEKVQKYRGTISTRIEHRPSILQT